MKLMFAIMVTVFMIGANNGQAAAAPHKPQSANVSLQAVDTEIVFGRKDAPVKLYEYVSLICHVCAKSVTKVKDDLLKKYGDDLCIIMRPLPFHAIDIHGSKLVLCSNDPASFLAHLFKTQEDWIKNSKPWDFIKGQAKKFGMTDKDIESCMADKQLEQQVVMYRMLTKSDAAPVLKIGQIKMVGLPKYDLITAAIDEALEYVKGGKPLSQFAGSSDLRKNLGLKPLEK